MVAFFVLLLYGFFRLTTVVIAIQGAPAPTTVSAPAVVTATTSTDTLNASPRALPGLGTQLMAAFVTVLATVMLVQQS